MDEKRYRLEIVTPRRTVYASEVLSFTAPGVVGGFQVLFNHASLLSSLHTGEVKIVETDGSEWRYATSGGFVEVRDNTVVLLAETAERSDEIDAARARASRDRAHRRLEERAPDLDVERARAALARALNRLKVSGSRAS
ncbi:MAG: F0F1 ATP synthase subunit epsilon [Bacteroidetes bacterium]|jgi:F-type H+-transporting ATPase subunit epsilon|nr:F0F1 ATP synthase subunit epsilon [Bacteroidota bacterium]